MSDSSPLPPVRLRPEAELARDALAAPMLARAVRLARWAGPDTRVGADGQLVDGQLPAAAAELGLGTEAEGAALAAQAWRVAVAVGLVNVAEGAGGTGGVDAAERAKGDEDGRGVAAVGGELALVTAGSPRDVLRLWLRALQAALDAASGLAPGVPGMRHDPPPGAADPVADAEFLDGVLGNLYLLSSGGNGSDWGDPAGRSGVQEGSVPLPALAASVIVPDDMTEPTDDVLEQVSDAMLRLDGQFRLLQTVGLVEFRPVDEALLADVGGEDASSQATGTEDGGTEGDSDSMPHADADVGRYGIVHLTELGRFGLRSRLLDAGFDVPVVGDLADQDAEALLYGTAGFPQDAAQDEIEMWLVRHEPLAGARELLAAARGGDAGAPLRRLRCQQALSLVGREAEPALREVLDDAELGGLARVWLTEKGAPDVPPPTEKMIFWLTIDTLAAQLTAEGNSEELQGLVEGLARQHSGFFDTAWRVDHPATTRVLEAMGRLHSDKLIAKQARKAAFKARSQQGG